VTSWNRHGRKTMSPEQTETRITPAPDPTQNGKPALTDEAAIPASAAAHVETRGERFGRKARRTRFQAYAVFTVVLLVCLVALVVANTRQVELSWVIGTSSASLVWIIVSSAVLGWLLGIVSGALVRWRTRAPRA
jgi:uncharacterized integral membrane protein